MARKPFGAGPPSQGIGRVVPKEVGFRLHPLRDSAGWDRWRRIPVPPSQRICRVGPKRGRKPTVHPLDHRCSIWVEPFPDGPSVGPPVQHLGGNLSRRSIRWTTGAAFGQKPFPTVHPLDHRCNFWAGTFPDGPSVGPPVQLLGGNLSRRSIRWTTGAAFGRNPFPTVHPLDHRCSFWAGTFPDGPSFGPPVQSLCV